MAPPPLGPRRPPPRAYILPAIFVVVMLVALWMRRPEPEALPGRHPAAFSGPTMGSTYSVKLVTPEPLPADRQQELGQQIEAVLASIDEKMSTWRDDSELVRFNRHLSTEPFPLSPETRAVLAAAITVSEQSGGAFDVTIAPLVEAWGFGVDESLRGPTDSEIAILMASVGSEKLHLDAVAGTARKDVAGLEADLSAIAPGYAADLIGQALEAQSISAYLVEVGGEVRARGQNARGVAWQVGIERPDAERGVLEEVVGLQDASLATSGDYRNYYEVDGQRISHTIDARSGKPIRHALASVTVIHPEAMWADAYATALNALGPEEGMALAEALGLPVLMLVRTAPGVFEARQTPSFSAYRVTEQD